MVGGAAVLIGVAAWSDERILENSRRGAITVIMGDGWRRFWGEKGPRGEVNGVEYVLRSDSAVTIIDIRVGGSDSTAKLERFFSRFLSACAETSVLIADVRGLEDENAFPLASLEHPVKRRRQIIGELPISSVQNLRLNWFDSHYTLLCIGNSISTSDEYTKEASRLCPDAALRRRLIRAYIAGDESEGYTLGIAGVHPEILPQLKEVISG